MSLKPCPFCGVVPVDTWKVKWPGKEAEDYTECKACGVRNRVSVWNRRAPLTVDDAMQVEAVRELRAFVQWVKDCGSPYQQQVAARVLAPFLAAMEGKP